MPQIKTTVPGGLEGKGERGPKEVKDHLRARTAEPTMRVLVPMHQPRARHNRAKDKEMMAGSGVSAPG